MHPRLEAKVQLAKEAIDALGDKDFSHEDYVEALEEIDSYLAPMLTLAVAEAGGWDDEEDDEEDDEDVVDDFYDEEE